MPPRRPRPCPAAPGGVEGTARAWSAGEPIARNWTAKDHADLIAAVREAKEGSDPAGTAAAALEGHQEDTAAHEALFAAKQDKLTGQPGQVVGFDGMGLAYAVPGWSNQNLLINSDFRNPVNRNGKTSYSGGGPTIDGWQAYTGAPAVSLEDGAIKFSKGDWGQPLRIKGILPGTYTMSALASGSNFAAFSFSIPAGSGPATYYFDIPGTNLRMTFAYKWIVQSHLFYLTNNSDADDARVIAAKLERGPIQTLAHQDADGKWVLNDPPPNKALELAKCQRYQVVYSATLNIAAVGFASNQTSVLAKISCPPLRGVPTLNFDKLYLSSGTNAGANSIPVTRVTDVFGDNGSYYVQFKCEGGLTPKEAVAVQIRGGYLMLDANL